MLFYLIACNSEHTEDQSNLTNIIRRLRSQLSVDETDILKKSHKCTQTKQDIFVKQIITDESWESVVYHDQEWKRLDAIDLNDFAVGPFQDNNFEKENENIKGYKLIDILNDTSDCLPYSGCIIDIVLLWTEYFNKSSHYTSVFGALRRLTDWHNARIFIPYNNAKTEQLQTTIDQLHPIVIKSETELFVEKQCIWRGKVSINDKVENKSLICPGFELTGTEGMSSNVSSPSMVLQHTGNARFGRMLEVLDEVDLNTIPSYLITGCKIHLSLYSDNVQSQMVLDYMRNSGDEVALLSRLLYYPKTETVCKDHNLSTSFWKENIMADISYFQEPEEEILNGGDYLYMVLTSSSDATHLVATILRSSEELNGELFHKMYLHSLLPVEESDRYIEETLSNLPQLDVNVLNYISDDLMRIQSHLLREWIDSRETNNKSVRVSKESLMTYLGEVEQIYLNIIKKDLPCVKLSNTTTEIEISSKSELDIPHVHWPERRALVYQESQRRALTRLQSSESVPLSSPIRPTETSSTVDVKDFLNFFHPDGSASCSGLSPIRCHKTKRTQLRNDTGNPADVSWPQCKDTPFHDIYYNKDRKAEKYEQHYVKVQNRYVSEETYSSCNSTVINLPKKHKNKKVTTEEDILKSPSRKSSRLEAKGTCSKKNTLLGKLSVDQKKTEHKRRISEPLGSESSKPLGISYTRTARISSEQRATPEVFKEPSSHSSNRNKSTTVWKHEIGTSVIAQVTSQATKLEVRANDCQGSAVSSTSTPSSTKGSDSSQGSKESRSQRHKRKLESIVAESLAANGIDKNHEMYKSCANKLFKVTKLFVMDLPNSRNLSEEMRKIAENQVKQVIDVEKRRSSMG